MTLGLVHALERDGIKVGFVKPIAQAASASAGAELSNHFARQLCNIDAPASIPLPARKPCCAKANWPR